MKPNREGKCTVAYRAILLSHRQLSKAWLFLKSCPHGFIRGKSSDSTKKREREKMMRNKKKGTYHQKKDKRRMKGFKHDL